MGGGGRRRGRRPPRAEVEAAAFRVWVSGGRRRLQWPADLEEVGGGGRTGGGGGSAGGGGRGGAGAPPAGQGRISGGRWPVAGEKKGGVDDGDGWIGWRLKMMVGHRILIGRLQIRVWKESKILGYAVDSP